MEHSTSSASVASALAHALAPVCSWSVSSADHAPLPRVIVQSLRSSALPVLVSVLAPASVFTAALVFVLALTFILAYACVRALAVLWLFAGQGYISNWLHSYDRFLLDSFLRHVLRDSANSSTDCGSCSTTMLA